MITEKSIIKTEVKFSEDKKYRYLLRKEWDTKKKKAMVIMINPSSANDISMDFTTLYTINNLQKLDYGSVDILNIYPKVTNKLKLTEVDSNELEVNDQLISEVAEKVDSIIIAWGKRGNNSKKIDERQKQILEKLSSHKDKIYIISDENGNIGFHPLAPQIRFTWILNNLIF